MAVVFLVVVFGFMVVEAVLVMDFVVVDVLVVFAVVVVLVDVDVVVVEFDTAAQLPGMRTSLIVLFSGFIM
jgi:hypothetical protein